MRYTLPKAKSESAAVVICTQSAKAGKLWAEGLAPQLGKTCGATNNHHVAEAPNASARLVRRCLAVVSDHLLNGSNGQERSSRPNAK